MVTVDLFKNPKSDNLGRMGNFSDLAEQTQYFNGLTGLHIQGTLSDDIGEIIVQYSWTTILGYTYGRYQSNGTYIYFSIRDIEVVNPTKTRILYDIDCWETARFQKNVTLGRGIVSRSGRSLSTMNPKPIEPVYTRTVEVQRLNTVSDLTALAIRHDNTNNTTELLATNASIASGISIFPSALINGWWLTTNDIDTSEVIGSWLSPFPVSFESSSWHDVATGNFAIKGIYLNYLDDTDLTHTVSLNHAPFGNAVSTYGITDMSGNIVWNCDLSDDFGSSLSMKLNVSSSGCSWRGWLMAGGSKVSEGSITIPCDTSDVWNDAFVQYQALQRAYDISMRQLNNDRQLQQSLTSIGTSALTGAIGGGLIGVAGIGAVAGAAVQAVSAGLNYQANVKFGAREQQITDRLYLNAQDTLSMSGTAQLSTIRGDTGVSLVRADVDPGTKAAYDSAVATAGYYYNSLEVEDMEDWIVDGPLCADVEVLGGIPSMWKEQIRARFSNGVIFS